MCQRLFDWGCTKTLFYSVSQNPMGVFNREQACLQRNMVTLFQSNICNVQEFCPDFTIPVERNGDGIPILTMIGIYLWVYNKAINYGVGHDSWTHCELTQPAKIRSHKLTFQRSLKRFYAMSFVQLLSCGIIEETHLIRVYLSGPFNGS